MCVNEESISSDDLEKKQTYDYSQENEYRREVDSRRKETISSADLEKKKKNRKKR